MNLFVERFMGIVAVIFIVYMFLYTTYLFISVLMGAIRLYDRNRAVRLKNEIKHDYYMPISVLVPAFNEEVLIVDSLRNLLVLEYKLYEIIIIDDGSTDQTLENLLMAFPFKETNKPIRLKIKCEKLLAVYEAEINQIKVTLIKKENGGKSDALNMGINVSKYPYFVTLDADSVLQADSLEKIIQPILSDEKVIAVGGMVRVAQTVKMKDGLVLDYRIPWHPIEGMQVVEYDRSFLASRILLDQFNGNLIISGAFGLYKKDIVIAVGGYKIDTIGEDMELVMRIHAFMLGNERDYKIHYQPEAICWSQMPSRLRDIFTQRRRWYFGLFQSLFSYPEMVSRFRYKPVGFISYISYTLFELFGPFIEVFGIATILLAWYFDILNAPFMISLFLIYTGYGIMLSMTAFFQRVYTQGLSIRMMDVLKAFVFVVLENAIYRYVISYVRVTAFIGYKRKRKTWNTIKRSKHKNISRFT